MRSSSAPGPNGLAAAITLARAGHPVTRPRGGRRRPAAASRSAELTLPGLRPRRVQRRSTSSAGSRRSSPTEPALARHGLRWIRPPAALGHPLDDGSAVAARARRRRDRAAARAPTPTRTGGPVRLLVRRWRRRCCRDLLAPFHVPLSPPRALRLARFGLLALQPATRVARRFRGDAGPGARSPGSRAHSILPLTEPVSAAAALVLGAAAHVDGWPLPEGGSGRLAARARRGARSRAADGSRPIAPSSGWLTSRRTASRSSTCRHGRSRRSPATASRLAFAAASSASATDRACSSSTSRSTARSRGSAGGAGPAGTVHLGGTLEEIARAEADVTAGRHPERPFVLLAQQSLFDRDPRAGRAAHGLGVLPRPERLDRRHDRADPRPDRALRAGIPRADPGRHRRPDRPRSSRRTTRTTSAATSPAGGSTSASCSRGRASGPRPVLRRPNPAIFLCSASTPPGGGVHGMSGMLAARSALRRLG